MVEEHKIDWRSKFKELLSMLPANYPEAGIIASEAGEAFLIELAAALRPRLNEYALTLPQDSLAEKQTTSAWLNRELREKKLTALCPRTHTPGIFSADSKNGDPTEDGSFRFQTHDKQGRRVTTGCWYSLPEFEIAPAPTRREAFSRGYQPYSMGGR